MKVLMDIRNLNMDIDVQLTMQHKPCTHQNAWIFI